MAAPLPTPETVATIILPPGDDDPKAVMLGGRFSVQWRKMSGCVAVTKFREVNAPRLVQEGLALPTLYLHFLDDEFRVEKGSLDYTLRSGNDSSEVLIKLPSRFTEDWFRCKCERLLREFKIVLETLRCHGEMLVSDSSGMTCTTHPGTVFHSLRTARPKAPISLDKMAFGIPRDSDQYLFVNNHTCVVYLDAEVREAFTTCINEFPEIDDADVVKLGIFLKVFYEGGFGYNKKIPMGSGYLPQNVGIAAMSVVPSFDGQIGIGTGYPYVLPSRFLPFAETVPTSIDAVSSMSDRHGRYGLAFTRCVYVWEGDAFATDGTLDFCSILPHGGFYYVPATMKAHKELGGLVYAFGESTADADVAAEI